MDQKIAVWNTGAQYTEHGQRIAATVVEGGIVFLDMDRGIDGLIPLANTVRDLRAQAQHGYDYGNYVSAWEHSDTLKQLAAAINAKSQPAETHKTFCSHYFPDYDDTLPQIDGFADASYGNDTCPSIHSETLGLTIHCDYKNEILRENEGCTRYSISDAGGDPLLDSDDLAEVLAFVADFDGSPEKCRNGKPLAKCTCC